MSRGPGKTQREILEMLTVVPSEETAQRLRWERAEPGEWPTRWIAYAVTGSQSRDKQRQIRRALESLARRGLVTKRIAKHWDYSGGGTRAMWKLSAP